MDDPDTERREIGGIVSRVDLPAASKPMMRHSRQERFARG